MRTRSTKPEFWRSKTIAGLPVSERLLVQNHLPRLVYSGPIGRIKDWHDMGARHPAVPKGSFTSFIYHLFDSSGEPIYFGKAGVPAYRFSSHQRKLWWDEVAHLNLYVVSCEGHADELCRGHGNDPRRTLERVALIWEHKAIADVQPRYNIAGMPRGDDE